MSEWLPFWPAVAFALNGLIGWGVWSARREFVSKPDVLTMTRALELMDRRVTAMEHDMAHRPDTAIVGELMIQLARLEGEVKALTDSLHAQRQLHEHQLRQAQLIDDVLRALHSQRSIGH